MPRDADWLDPLVWKVTSVAVVGSFLSQLDATVVNVSLSSLAVQLHSSLAAIQWVTSDYLLALALTLPLNSWLVERIGANLSTSAASPLLLCPQPCGHGLVCERTDWISNPAGHERRADGSDGAYDDRADCWKTCGTHHWLCARARHVGANSRPRDCRRQSATRILAVALSRQPAGRCIGNRIGRSFSAERELDVVGFVLVSPGLVLFLHGSDHIGERIGLLTLLLSIVLLATFFRMAICKADRALIDLQLFRGKTFANSAVTQLCRTESRPRARC